MDVDIKQIKALFKGLFLTRPEVMQEKILQAKAYVFDWDGVFNNGMKDENGSSPFSEVDAMGTNLLRFNHYLWAGHIPFTAIISGEKNKAAFTITEREHFDIAYYNIKNKKEALSHLCHHLSIKPHEVVFFFDDVLDLPIAELCGIRMMIGRSSNPLLTNFVIENKLADYISFADGGNNGVRESIELITGISGLYNDTILQRIQNTAKYQKYIHTRNGTDPVYYTAIENVITEQTPQ